MNYLNYPEYFEMGGNFKRCSVTCCNMIPFVCKAVLLCFEDIVVSNFLQEDQNQGPLAIQILNALVSDVNSVCLFYCRIIVNEFWFSRHLNKRESNE